MTTEANQVARCKWCGTTKPGNRGFSNCGNYHRFRQDCVLHPIRGLAMARGFTTCEAMNWLQDRGLIADECVEFWQVAAVDIYRVMEEAAFILNPAWIAVVRNNFEEKW